MLNSPPLALPSHRPAQWTSGIPVMGCGCSRTFGDAGTARASGRRGRPSSTCVDKLLACYLSKRRDPVSLKGFACLFPVCSLVTCAGVSTLSQRSGRTGVFARSVDVLATGANGLDQPNSVAFGTGARDHQTLFTSTSQSPRLRQPQGSSSRPSGRLGSRSRSGLTTRSRPRSRRRKRTSW